MKIGLRIKHRSRPDLGYGKITHLYDDNHCDASFGTARFSWIPLSEVSSAEAEIFVGEIQVLLEGGRFEEASDYYQREGRRRVSLAKFEDLLRRAREREESRRVEGELQRIAQERKALQARVSSLLADANIQAADELYLGHCSDWWPSQDYESLRAQFVLLRDVTRSYISAPMAELDRVYADSNQTRIPPHEFARLKLPKLRVRLARLGLPLSGEQQLACAMPQRHRLIRARAGSGKTRILAAQAALAIHDERLSADQILVLAFNKKAAQELGDRIRKAAGVVEFRNARTFHSLAWQLADHAGRELIFDDGNLAPSRQKQKQFMERAIATIMNPAFRELLYEFFRRELKQLDRLGSGLSGKAYLAFRRAMVDYALGGETVRSNGEKFIADFLFEHGISYAYEKVVSRKRADFVRGGPYRPDFSIVSAGRDVILEHWAIDPEDSAAQVPDWWSTTTSEYREQIAWKRAFWRDRGIRLLETHAGWTSAGREIFEERLRSLLEMAGITCHKLAPEVLVRRVAEAPRAVSRMAELFLQFISRAKRRGWSVETAASKIRSTADEEPRNCAFHELAIRAYAEYERMLHAHPAMDFDDLLVSATETINREGASARLRLSNNDSISLCDLRWILIDEFQDFSELYCRAITALLKINPSIRIVAVGDDWQAINGFAGAQLTFFDRFEEFFPQAGLANVSVNRRSGRRLVRFGNEVMSGNGEPAVAHYETDGEVAIEHVDTVWLEEASIYLDAATTVEHDGRQSVNWTLARALKACTKQIVDAVYVDLDRGVRLIPRVLILARTNRVYNVDLSGFEKRLAQVLRKHPDLQELENDFVVGSRSVRGDEGATRLEVMTVHKAKGKEADTVILLDVTLGQFPKIHSDNQLFGPFGVTAEDVLAEERRLFYVAVSRAEHRLSILTETGKESPFVGELNLASPLPEVEEYREQSDAGDFATEFVRHFEQDERRELIRKNISPRALAVWDAIGIETLPEVGHSLASNLHAELAWPNLSPPLAIITGAHADLGERWREHGWDVRIA